MLKRWGIGCWQLRYFQAPSPEELMSMIGDLRLLAMGWKNRFVTFSHDLPQSRHPQSSALVSIISFPLRGFYAWRIQTQVSHRHRDTVLRGNTQLHVHVVGHRFGATCWPTGTLSARYRIRSVARRFALPPSTRTSSTLAGAVTTAQLMSWLVTTIHRRKQPDLPGRT
jgi:hypothetical protein